MPTQPTNNRKRRVTDKQGVSFDQASLAVRIAQMDGAHQLLQSEVKQSMTHLASSLDSVQVEVRRAVDKVGDISSLQNAREQDRETMSRIERMVTALSEKVDTRLDRFEVENESRWERHEADNEDAEREVQTKLTDLDRKMVRALGWVGGFSGMAALLLGVVVYTVNLRFDNISNDARKIDPLVEKIHTIELYLARDGQRHKETK